MKEHAGVDVVTISADIVPNLPDATQSMLDNAGLRKAENWIFSDGFVERLRFEIDPTWQGDIPRTILVSRNGTAATIEGSAEMHDLEKWADQQTAPATPLDNSVKNEDFFTHLHTDKAMANVTVSPGRVGPVDIAIQLETTNEEPLAANPCWSLFPMDHQVTRSRRSRRHWRATTNGMWRPLFRRLGRGCLGSS
jgi:hypothetical protein